MVLVTPDPEVKSFRRQVDGNARRFLLTARGHQSSPRHGGTASISIPPFAAKSLETCEKLVTLSAAVAQSDLPEQTHTAKRQELDKIVNGQLALVADDNVFGAISDLIGCADNRRCTKGSLALYSRNVVRASRNSLEESWKVNLPPVSSSDSLPSDLQNYDR
jgi:hypothetical protein